MQPPGTQCFSTTPGQGDFGVKTKTNERYISDYSRCISRR